MSALAVKILAVAALAALGAVSILLELGSGQAREARVAAVGAACTLLVAVLAAASLAPRDAAIWWVFGLAPLSMAYNFNRVRREDWLSRRPVRGVVSLQLGATLFLLLTLWFLAR